MRRYRYIPTMVYLVKSAEASFRAHIDRIVKEHHLTALQYTALGVLAQRDGLTSAQLARRAFVTPQSMQDMVRALEMKGFITRERSATDRRDLIISLTEEGRRVLATVEPPTAEFDDAILEGFTDAEIETFRAMLVRAQQNASRLWDDLRSSPALPDARSCASAQSRHGGTAPRRLTLEQATRGASVTTDAETTVHRNDEKGRYEIHLDDTVAGFTEFHADEHGRLVFPHTAIDPAFSGRGLGSVLVGGALTDVAARGETVVPECPFVVKYLRGNEIDGLDVYWRPTADAAGSAGVDT